MVHRRRNQGGTGGTCPPQPAGKGGSVPTVRAMPIHAVLGLTMKYHEWVATKSVLVDLPLVFSLTQPRNSCQLWSSTKIMLNGRGFNEKWVGLKFFVRAVHAIISISPPNLHHLPTPRWCVLSLSSHWGEGGGWGSWAVRGRSFPLPPPVDRTLVYM